MNNIHRVEPTETDWAKLAAYIDGEGCIAVKYIGKHNSPTQRRYHLLEIGVSNSDPRLPIWCCARFGGTIQYRTRPDRPTHRQGFFWRVSSRKAASILQKCMEHFVIKREQAEVAIAFQNTMRLVPEGPSSELSTDVLELREQLKERLSALKREIVPAPELVRRRSA